MLAATQPNPGHYALVELEKRIPEFTLITQNVDGLHQQAGSKRVLELHGNIRRTKCFTENTIVDSWPADVNDAYRMVAHHVLMAVLDVNENAQGAAAGKLGGDTAKPIEPGK